MLSWPKALEKFMFEIFRYDGAGLSSGEFASCIAAPASDARVSGRWNQGEYFW